MTNSIASFLTIEKHGNRKRLAPPYYQSQERNMMPVTIGA